MGINKAHNKRPHWINFAAVSFVKTSRKAASITLLGEPGVRTIMHSTYIAQNWLPGGHFNCEGVLDDYEGFPILAKGESLSSPMYRILFDCVVAYSSIEESSSFNDRRRAPGLTAVGCCYEVGNSWYLDELHQVSSGVREGEDIRHYAFYFSNQCIDVLAYGKPKVENLCDIKSHA